VLTIQWTREASEGDFSNVFSYRSADPHDATIHPSVYKRIFAHLVLDELPEGAMGEVLDFLGNVWIFNQPTAPQIAPTTKTIRGKVTRRYERPTYSIEE